MPLPDASTYQVIGAFAPEPEHERNTVTYDDWKLDTPTEYATDEEYDAAFDAHLEWLENRAHNQENNNND